MGVGRVEPWSVLRERIGLQALDPHYMEVLRQRRGGQRRWREQPVPQDAGENRDFDESVARGILLMESVARLLGTDQVDGSPLSERRVDQRQDVESKYPTQSFP